MCYNSRTTFIFRVKSPNILLFLNALMYTQKKSETSKVNKHLKY